MKQPVQIPTPEELETLLGEEVYRVWTSICRLVEEKYEMEKLWSHGGKAWIYEYKYRRGGKTLCALYAKENGLGLMVILGKDERSKFDERRQLFSPEVQTMYDKATTYHDGKWVMFELKDTNLLHDLERLLEIKRKPNKASRPTE